ncbi:response regulator transcription factor [Pseudoxanthomonas sp. SE1]|uniref:response regulator n=1 Tax=Pseudoxanthomonas sp. SE1 TaxID=1664560 RepID=UPI00240DEB7B|nr:response regulator transcription factor [Pseudoxanthomonas sp. SE1]WFC41553.1 response regulator transcription factor [Pseudoxanthomonas sp. SE1]
MPDRISHCDDALGSLRPRVLMVDDDAEITRMLSRYLENHGLTVTVAASGARFRALLETTEVDVILLDLGLPDTDGLGLVRELRHYWQGPLIIVSGRGESVDRVVGLELGADDYISKPFDLRELLARIRSVLRRTPPPGHLAPHAKSGFEFFGLRLDTSARRLIDRDGCDIELTTGEFELLFALLRRPNQVLSRDQLMNATHGRETGPFDRAIDMQVNRLRRKIEVDPAHPRIIKSIRGVGYMLAAPAPAG